MSIEPFTRLTFYSKSDREKWLPIINGCSELYRLTEFATFKAKMRRCYVLHVNPDSLEYYLSLIGSRDYYYIPMLRSKCYQGFSHRHIPPKEGDKWFVYGVLSHTKEDAELFVEASNKGDHKTIGLLLGYPECCIDSFIDRWCSKGIIDPIYEAYGDECIVHPYCNQALRYFGLRITPHLPCSGNCESTIKMGSDWFSIMKQINSVHADYLFNILSMPFTWSCMNGVAIIDTPIFRGVTNSNFDSKLKIVRNKGYNR